MANIERIPRLIFFVELPSEDSRRQLVRNGIPASWSRQVQGAMLVLSLKLKHKCIESAYGERGRDRCV